MTKDILPKAIILVGMMTVLCGLIYPLMITGIAQSLFREKANGSIVTIDHVQYGSELLGQQFTGEEYLWGRIMKLDTETFIGKDGKKVMYAKPSNLSPASEEYAGLIKERVDKILAANPGAKEETIPVDLVTCSGSGMDPDISIAAANYQISRIATIRQIPEKEVEKIIKKYTTGRFAGVFGEPVVNVLKVNLALDGLLQ